MSQSYFKVTLSLSFSDSNPSSLSASSEEIITQRMTNDWGYEGENNGIEESSEEKRIPGSKKEEREDYSMFKDSFSLIPSKYFIHPFP